MLATTLRATMWFLAAASTLVAQPRPMTFLDAQHLRNVGAPALSPDGGSMLFTLSVPDWKEARRFTDVWVVSTAEGVASARQLTFTKDKNETNPRWSSDGRYFVFSSNREGTGAAATQQLYVMHPNGGEARKLTDAKNGVGQFAFSRDGKWLVFGAGKSDEQQLWALPAGEIEAGEPTAVQLTKHATPIGWWSLSKDGSRIFFLSVDTAATDRKNRLEKGFNVAVRNEDLPLQHLWVFEMEARTEQRLTEGSAYSVGGVTLSDDGHWVGFRGAPNNRYSRTVTESGMHDDLYLLEVASRKIERLTNNQEVGESPLRFSPDGSRIAFAASNDFSYSRDEKIYLRRTADAGGAWQKLGGGYDGGLSVGWWSPDGGTIYFGDGVKVTNQVLALDIATNTVRQVTTVRGSVRVNRDDETGLLLLTYETPHEPPSLQLIRSEADLGDPARWTRLTDANPQVREWALGEVEEVNWRSKDGRMVGGVLVKPVGYTAGRHYPLIVQMHGGPAGADVLGFNDGYGSQVYAGAGYAVLLPNYRGSTNYGERHRIETAGVGKYFDRGFEDIMTGVDYLIARGIAHPDSLGAMGWSAGGHYSNWILTHTTRFKAISSGAGTVNWISMYAQSDVQRNRQWYMGGSLPYDNYDAYWQVSPLKYIKNARTPTLIHVVDGDPRVPRPQSEELHMALKRLNVPTELFVYPGQSHGIPDPRNQLTKAVVEFHWFEKWIRGKPGWFEWSELIKTVEGKVEGK